MKRWAVWASWWDDAVFCQTYAVVVCEREALGPWVEKTFGPEYEVPMNASAQATTLDVFDHPKGSAAVVWFPKRGTLDAGALNIIAHEAVHCATATLLRKGVLFTREGDEPWAYYIGYLVEQIYSRLKTAPGWKPRAKRS